MTNTEYIALAMRTESKRLPLLTMDELCTTFSYSRILHSTLGCADEAGEIVKTIKDCLFYGKEIDVTNLKEEYGDQLWYIAIGLDAIGSSFEEVMEMNIRKLRARFPEKFSDVKATERDLEAERGALTDELECFGHYNHTHILCMQICDISQRCKNKSACAVIPFPVPTCFGEYSKKQLCTERCGLSVPCQKWRAKVNVPETKPPITVDLITVVDLPENAAVVSETGAYHAIMSGQAKGEIVQLGDNYVMRIRE